MLVIVGARPADAAEPTAADRVLARQWFQEGIALESRGEWEAALARFKDTVSVVSSPNVQYHLGLCLEHLSKLVQALDAFEQALSAARGASLPDPALIANAEEHIGALRRRIPTMTLRWPADVALEAREVTIDDQPSAAAVRAGVPLDPGEHRLRVDVPNRPPFEAKVTLPEKNTVVVVDVVLPSAAPASNGPVPSTRVAALQPTPATTPPRHPVRPWMFVSGGVAVVLLGSSVAMYVLRADAVRELDAVCGGDRQSCPAAKRDLIDRGATYTTLGNVFLGVGVGAAIGTGVLALVDRSSTKPSKVSVRVGPSGLVVRAAF